MPLPHFIRSFVEMTVMLHGEVNTGRVHIRPALSSSTLAEFKRDNDNRLVIKTPDNKKRLQIVPEEALSTIIVEVPARRCDVGRHPDCFEAYHQ